MRLQNIAERGEQNVSVLDVTLVDNLFTTAEPAQSLRRSYAEPALRADVVTINGDFSTTTSSKFDSFFCGNPRAPLCAVPGGWPGVGAL